MKYSHSNFSHYSPTIVPNHKDVDEETNDYTVSDDATTILTSVKSLLQLSEESSVRSNSGSETLSDTSHNDVGTISFSVLSAKVS